MLSTATEHLPPGESANFFVPERVFNTIAYEALRWAEKVFANRGTADSKFYLGGWYKITFETEDGRQWQDTRLFDVNGGTDWPISRATDGITLPEFTIDGRCFFRASLTYGVYGPDLKKLS